MELADEGLDLTVDALWLVDQVVEQVDNLRDEVGVELSELVEEVALAFEETNVGDGALWADEVEEV